MGFVGWGIDFRPALARVGSATVNVRLPLSIFIPGVETPPGWGQHEALTAEAGDVSVRIAQYL